MADRLLRLQQTLAAGTYRPGRYEHFFIHEPKRRRISAAPFADRVVHHALCNIIDPAFELRCSVYVRYVDDLILFAPDKTTLWEWKGRCVERLARLRLTIHESQAQVQPVGTGLPWLGFVIFPDRRLVKGRKVRAAAKHLGRRFADWRAGRISFAAFDASIQGWIGHVSHADSWRLRGRVLQRFVW